MKDLHGSAFGLAVRGTDPVHGVLPGPDTASSRRCRFTLVDRGVLDGDFPARSATAVLRRLSSAGVRGLDADRDRAGRWRLEMPGFAVCVVDPAGDAVSCAPTSAAWSRFVVGQGLPLAAVLHGLEPFHASAVAMDDRAIGFIGASHAGKTTLALALALEGAQLLTDDVLVMETREGEVIAHAGAGIVNARHGAVQLLPTPGVAGLGEEVSRDEFGIRVAVQLQRGALPLGLLYWIERRGDHSAPAFELMDAPDPRMLLGASFNFAVQDPERLARQLDLCWHLARGVPLVHARLPSLLAPELSAAAVAADARERVG